MASLDNGIALWIDKVKATCQVGCDLGNESLHNLADVYRRRAHYQAEKLAVFLPTILMIAIGASATLFYCLALFVPLANMLRQLTAA